MNYANDYKAIIYNEEYIDDKNTTFIANGESGRVVKILKEQWLLIMMERLSISQKVL